MAQLIVTAASTAAGAVAKSGLGAFLVRTAATTAGAYAAGYAQRLVFGPQKRTVEGPRLNGFSLQAAQEGAPVLRVYGRARVSGQLIWAANFRETVSETTEGAGGKGGARTSSQTTFREYLYSVSFAVGLCEGEIDRVGRVWADGKPFDISRHNVRIYRGTETQNPDGLIEAVEGAGAAPGFRGLAYVVFEDLPLKDFGNRIPQLSFEVEKSLRRNDPDALENILTAVSMIPGSGEFVYGTTPVARALGEGETVSENRHNPAGVSDFVASLDALMETAPNLRHVSLIVSWFGTSLDAGACDLRPGVAAPEKTTAPYAWRVGGTDRAAAHLVSTVGGAPAYGGAPADRAVVEAIAELKARGLKVMLHPFILMDAPGYPWRGRIDAGAGEGTAAAAGAVAQFFGTAAPQHFTPALDTVEYAGPAEWSFRRMILHYAHLCALAGGVDAFLLGSELRGLTTARDGAGAYPAVAAMKALAADARSVLGAQTEISYGADWSEYFGHQPPDQPGGLMFHLDDLWSDPNIDFIGIDNYMPLADWRDGFGHLDAAAGAAGPYDRDYLMGNIRGGEGYDWFYADAHARDAQARTPIADGAYGEPWVWRYKDLWNWWANPHHDRPGGVRQAAPTGWVPRSKPIVFTETGCPAVDKGANQPNVFVDPKSTESAVPHYSGGSRDDAAQRSVLEAQGAFWRTAENNPVSSVYGGPMVAAERQYVWAYDARPFPDFPARADVWADGANWEKGHWLNGRLGRAPLGLLAAALAEEADFREVSAGRLEGVLAGYVVDRPLSVREMIDGLADVYQFDVVETGAALRFQPRHGGPVMSFDAGALAERDGGAFSLSLGQETDRPAAFRLGFLDEAADFSPAVVEARDPGAAPVRQAGIDIAAAIPAAEAEARARSILADAWVMRETLSLALPPSALAAEPGDAIVLNDLGTDRLYRITDISDGAAGGAAREADLVRVSPEVYNAPPGAAAFAAPAAVPVFGPPAWELMDLPLMREGDDPAAPWFAAFAEPWPGAAVLYRAETLAGTASLRAVMGRLETPLPAARSGRWDRRVAEVRLSFGTLASRAEADVLDGANAFAVQSANGAWELAQFRDAELQPDGRWRLSGFLRGQAGTEAEAAAGAGAGARFVLMNAAPAQVPFSAGLRGTAFSWSAGPDGDLPGTENFTGRTLTLTARGLKPLSPVHLRARREGGDIRLSWIRRTRVGGDSWEGEVPLAEAFERYRLEIRKDGAVVRETETAAPDYLYAAADILADFGPGFDVAAPGASLVFCVAQLSDAAGEGATAEAACRVE